LGLFFGTSQFSGEKKMSDVARAGAIVGGFVGIFILCFAFFGLALGIAAVTIANHYGDDPCIGVYDGISFEYGTWLFVYGWVQIAVFIGVCVIGAFLAIAMFANNVALASCSGCLLVVSFALSMMFQFAWYVVGGVLYFTEVFQTCPRSSPLYVFGLTLFILQSLSVFCGYGGWKAKKNDE
jgi:hypothetical protein